MSALDQLMTGALPGEVVDVRMDTETPAPRPLSAVDLVAAEKLGKVAAGIARAQIKAPWTTIALACEATSTAAVVAMLADGLSIIGTAIDKAKASNAVDVHLSGVPFELKRNKVGEYAPTSKQAPYMRVSDWSSLVGRIGKLSANQQAECLRDNDKETAPLRTENQASAKAGEFERFNQQAGASPFHRFNLRRAHLTAQAEKLAKEEVAARKAAAAASQSTALALQALAELDNEIADFEAAATATVNAAGKYDASAMQEAQRKAEAAEAAKVAAEAAKVAAEEEADKARKEVAAAEQKVHDLRAMLAAGQQAAAPTTNKVAKRRVNG